MGIPADGTGRVGPTRIERSRLRSIPGLRTRRGAAAYLLASGSAIAGVSMLLGRGVGLRDGWTWPMIGLTLAALGVHVVAGPWGYLDRPWQVGRARLRVNLRPAVSLWWALVVLFVASMAVGVPVSAAQVEVSPGWAFLWMPFFIGSGFIGVLVAWSCLVSLGESAVRRWRAEPGRGNEFAEWPPMPTHLLPAATSPAELAVAAVLSARGQLWEDPQLLRQWRSHGRRALVTTAAAALGVVVAWLASRADRPAVEALASVLAAGAGAWGLVGLARSAAMAEVLQEGRLVETAVEEAGGTLLGAPVVRVAVDPRSARSAVVVIRGFAAGNFYPALPGPDPATQPVRTRMVVAESRWLAFVDDGGSLVLGRLPRSQGQALRWLDRVALWPAARHGDEVTR